MALLARERLIVALDVPSVAAAEAMVARLGKSVWFYKIGYQLVFAGGLPFAAGLIATGKQVFLDLKLHDIGNTVAKGVESVAQLGATFLTVHAYPQTMKAAVEGKRGSKLRILAVTVLTSYDDADLAAAGYEMNVKELAAARAAQARDTGVDGLVCSAEEAATLRDIVGPGMVLVTPKSGRRAVRKATKSASCPPRMRLTPARTILWLAVRLWKRAIPKPWQMRSLPRLNRSARKAAQGERRMAKGYWIANVSTCAMQMATKNMSPRCPIFCANLVA